MSELWSRAVATWRRFREESEKRWYLYLIVYLVLAFLGARIEDAADGIVSFMNASGLVEDGVRSLIGPVGVLAFLVGGLLTHAYLDTRRHPDRGWYEDEWSKLDQAGNWDEVQGLVRTVESEIEAALSKTEPLTVKDLGILRARVDSMDVRAAGYSETWGVGQFWADRNRWKPRPRSPAPAPWAAVLMDRVDFARWWIHGHSPHIPYPMGGVGDFGSWDGDFGSSV